MEILAKQQCASNGCPTVFRIDSEDLVVQGYIEDMDTTSGERAVRISQDLLIEAVAAIQAGR
jgi:hypothetical protein